MEETHHPHEEAPEAKSASKVPKKRQPQKKTAPSQESKTGSSGFTSYMRSLASTVTVYRSPEVTFFLVNFVSIASLSMKFEESCRSEPAPGGHAANYHYAAYFFWVLLAKLYAVGVATGQLRGFGNTFTPQHSDNLILPPNLCAVIESIGEFEDPDNKVVLRPLVNVRTLTYAYWLHAHFVGLAYVPYGQMGAFDPLTLRSYLQLAYDDGIQIAAAWKSFCLRRGLPVTFGNTSINEVGRLLGCIEGATAARLAAAPTFQYTVAHFDADFRPMYLLQDNAVPLVPAVGAHPMITAISRPQFLQSQVDWLSVSPFATNVLYGTANAIGLCLLDEHTLLWFQQWMRKTFLTRQMVFSKSGSPASTVVVINQGPQMSLACVVRTSPEEMVLGALLDNRFVPMVDVELNLMNHSDNRRATATYSTQTLRCNSVTLFFSSMNEMLLSKKAVQG